MNETLRTLFKIGEKYTLYRISGMATTVKQEIKVVRYFDGNPVYKEKGKKKELILRLEYREYAGDVVRVFDGAVFADWDQPIRCDTERFGFGSCIMRGNACFNFVAPVGMIKEWIDTKQMNPHFRKGFVLSVRANSEGDEVLVYPDLYTGGHAVLERLSLEQKKS